MFGIRKDPAPPVDALPPHPLRAQLQGMITELLGQAVGVLKLPIPTAALAGPLRSTLNGRSDADLADMVAVARGAVDQLWMQLTPAEQAAALARVARTGT